MNDTLQARIIDTHTVQLGNGENWTCLSLPWLARDLAELLYQARGRASPNATDLDKERIAALRLVLTQLETDIEPFTATVTSMPCPVKYYREATVIEADEKIPAAGPVVLVLRPTQMFALEEKLALRDADALTSVLVYSGVAVMVGPVLETHR
ncbi:MAG: hypothetical protein NTV43_15250 [Methylococcales bacterium]|nr:hypothetical protein [Methylococcales bacterium]